MNGSGLGDMLQGRTTRLQGMHLLFMRFIQYADVYWLYM